MKLHFCRILAALAILAYGGGAADGRIRDKSPRLLNGIDVLRRQNFAPLAGKRVGDGRRS